MKVKKNKLKINDFVSEPKNISEIVQSQADTESTYDPGLSSTDMVIYDSKPETHGKSKVAATTLSYSDLRNFSKDQDRAKGDQISMKSTQDEPLYAKKKFYVNKYGDEVEIE